MQRMKFEKYEQLAKESNLDEIINAGNIKKMKW